MKEKIVKEKKNGCILDFKEILIFFFSFFLKVGFIKHIMTRVVVKIPTG